MLLIVIGVIVYFVINHSKKQNNNYQIFAEQNGFGFEKGMVVVGSYREYTKNTAEITIEIPVSNPIIDKYANFKNFPFGRGVEQQVSYIIKGNYREVPFRAFTYQFTGNLLDGSRGGTFGIVMIQVNQVQEDLPENTFYENGFLYHYESGSLKTETIFSILDDLLTLKI